MASRVRIHAQGTPLTSIDHIGVAVTDLPAAIAFYESTLGFTVVHEETNEISGIKEVMLAVGDSGSFIQLLAPLTPESVIAKFLDRDGPGVQHIAFRVDDVEAAAAGFRRSGVRMLHDKPAIGTAGSLINFAHPKDCGGVLIELMQPQPEVGPTA